MFAPERLAKLAPLHRLRKAALLLELLERELLGSGDAAAGQGALGTAGRIASVLLRLPETPATVLEAAAALEEALSAAGGGEAGAGLAAEAALRRLDELRHSLLREGGQSRADWDLIDPETGSRAGARRPLPGLKAYLEDLRSPFNVGSMLRTGEALGLEELILSPRTADPGHPRAARSSMGAAELLPWRRAGLEALEAEGPAFALELGGCPLEDFEFPDRGIVVLGSEELGVSREALERCALGAVSIPLRGAKASLNVGVAFGILLQAWASRIDAHA